MKEELQGKLVEILTSIQTAAGKASDFAMAELPDIAQSYIAYGRVIESVGVLAPLVVLAAAVFVALKYCVFNKAWVYPSGHWRAGGWTDGRQMLTAGCVAFALISLVASVSGMRGAALVWFAPKVWLLKEIAGMLK
jgi:hypothetical protein